MNAPQRNVYFAVGGSQAQDGGGGRHEGSLYNTQRSRYFVRALVYLASRRYCPRGLLVAAGSTSDAVTTPLGPSRQKAQHGPQCRTIVDITGMSSMQNSLRLCENMADSAARVESDPRRQRNEAAKARWWWWWGEGALAGADASQIKLIRGAGVWVAPTDQPDRLRSRSLAR